MKKEHEWGILDDRRMSELCSGKGEKEVEVGG